MQVTRKNYARILWFWNQATANWYAMQRLWNRWMEYGQREDQDAYSLACKRYAWSVSQLPSNWNDQGETAYKHG